MTMSTGQQDRATTPAAPSSGADLSARIHARELSCREVMQAFLAQVDRLNPQFNAIVSRVDPDVLLHQAG